MKSAKDKFYQIFYHLSQNDPDISIGKMMSSPGIKYKSKVIAFYHNDEMIFRVGKKIDLKKHGIINPKFLSPFKTKPPMKGWISLTYSDENRWEEFTEISLDVMRSEID